MKAAKCSGKFGLKHKTTQKISYAGRLRHKSAAFPSSWDVHGVGYRRHQ